MLINRRRLQQLQGFLLGLAIAAGTAVFFFARDNEPRLELMSFDWRMRHFNTLPADPRIVHVDIDDGSLDRIGRWPWPRSQMADLIGTIAEFNPEMILVDFLFSEPEKLQLADPRLDALPGEKVEIVGELSEANLLYGDLELAEAIRRAGCVIMSTQLDIRLPGHPLPLSRQLYDYFDRHPDASTDDAVMALDETEHMEDVETVHRLALRERATRLLISNFTLNEHELADRLAAPTDEVLRILAGAKTEAARRRVRTLLENGHKPDPEQILDAVLGEESGRRTADRRDLWMAINRQQALEILLKSLYPAKAEAMARLPRAENVAPLLAPLAEAAMDIAAVNFRPDIDGSVRRVPVLIDVEQGVLPHLGLSAAIHTLGLNLSGLALDGSDLLLTSNKDQPRRLPLDRDGAMVIHWSGTAPRWREGKDMPHLSAAKLMSIVDARRQRRDNDVSMKYLLADLVTVAKGEFSVELREGAESGPETHTADAHYLRLVGEQVKLEQELRLARLMSTGTPEDRRAMEDRLAKLQNEIVTIESQAIDTIELTCREFAEIPQEEIDADPKLAADARRFRSAKKIIDEQLSARRRANESMQAMIDRTKQELNDHLAGKFVFLGFAATAQGDIVTTPIDPRTNGVMCHAHVLNAILQDRLIRIAPAWVGVLICLAAGAIVSFLTSTQPPRWALTATIGLLAAYLLFNCEVLFKRMDVWAALAAPLVCMFLTWAFVTLFRQLTAERERRLFAKQLGQYTSPAIAARIAENPQAAQVFKTVQTREVTCYFSDLKGFTTLTEAEDPELIQRVLNTYLHRMSQVIWNQRGLLNKFMGDGIMAFFNASVDPMPEHARAAVEASLIGLEELEKLKQERRGDPAARIFDALQMRIGLATGMAMNGDMGSEIKADYTVIGDVVNLAARLEPANKVFGTSILVSGPTREVVRDDFEFRYLAELQVKGKAQTIPVYEVVGRKGTLTPDQREYIERFEHGVELYKQRRWDECIVHFTRMLARRFDDAGASRYIDACQEFKTFPPDDDWRGALELKEK